MRVVMLASLLLVALSARSVDSAKQKVKDPAAAFERRYDAAMAAAREGDLETAYTKFKAAAKLKSEDPAVLHSLGSLALVLEGGVAKAVDYHTRAKAADATVLPPLAVLHQDGEKCNGLSDVYWVSSFVKKSLFDAPDDMKRRIGAHISLATQLEDSGLVDQAQLHFRLAGELQETEPTDLLLRNKLMVPVLYDSVEHVASIRADLEASLATLLHPNMTSVRLDALNQVSMPGTFYIVYQGYNDRDVLLQIQRLYSQIYPPFQEGTLVQAGTADSSASMGVAATTQRKTRVGFVSAHFRRHSVCKLICGVIKGLDREQFEVVVFSSTKKDEWTKGLADATDFHHLPTGMLISNRELVLQQNLDVLVFPDIGMDTKTAMWGGARLAPVQICFWGHPTTTGMHSMDYFVTSDSFEPNDAQGRFTEQLVRFDSTSFYFETPSWTLANLTQAPIRAAPAPDSKSKRGQEFLDRSAIYLIPQTLPKFHPDFDEAIRKILEADPTDSVVVIIFNKDKVFWKNRLLARFKESLGELVSRIMFVPSVAANQFAALMDASTVVLDPFPFGGGVTSLEAFSLCKPVITLPDKQTVPQLTKGMYEHMGMGELVARSLDEFAELAVRVRQDSVWREQVMRSICETNSVLYSSDATVLEWQRFLRGL